MKLFKEIGLGILVTLMGISCSAKQNQNTPPENEAAAPVVTTPEKIFMKVELEDFERVKAGEVLKMDLTGSDSVFKFTVRKVQEPISGVTTISGYVTDMNSGMVSLVFSKGRLAGSIYLYSEEKEFSVGYDSLQASYYLQEIPPEMKDRLEGGEPLIPGRDNL